MSGTARAEPHDAVPMQRDGGSSAGGVDDLAAGLGSVRFSVFTGAGVQLWQSPLMNGTDPAVPMGISIAGQQRIRLVVEPAAPFGGVVPADWAESRISCR